jgi:hypothetical protein
MSTRTTWRRGAVAAAFVAALSAVAIVAGPAGAKPKPAFAPKAGTYSGDSFAEGKTHSVFAQVKKKGSKYSAEVEIAVPAKCTSTESPTPLPTELLFKVPAQIKGRSISFKANSVDAMQIVGYQVASAITLNGRFTSPSAFSATVSVQAPAPGVESEVHCSVPPTKLKFEFSIAV